MHKGYLKALQTEKIIGIENYLQEIDTILSSEDSHNENSSNLPILITGDAHSGKSSLLAQ